MSAIRRTLVLTAMAAAAPTVALGQDVGTILGNILKAVVSVDGNYFIAGPITRSGVTSRNPGFGLHGLGVEALIDLPLTVHCDTVQRHPNTTPAAPRTSASSDTLRVDTTLTQIRVRRPIPGGGDTVSIYTVSKSCSKRSDWDLELGINYSQLSGFRGDTSSQGAVEDKPEISLYVTPPLQRWLHWDFLKVVKPYVGISAGLASLKDFRGTQDTVVYNASGSTWEFGVSVGIAVIPFPRADNGFAIFADWSWTHRTFDEATWAGPAGAKPFITPSSFGPIDLSTYAWSVGIQIQFGKDSTSSGPP